MTDLIVETPQAPLATPEPAPANVPAVVAATPPAPVEPPAPAPAVEAPAAPVAEVPAPEPAPHPATTPSLLEQIDVKTGAPKAPEPVAAPITPAVPAAASEAPIEYKFNLPAVLEEAPEQMAEYTGILNKGRISPEIGQELLDLHAAKMTEYANYLRQNQVDVFLQTRNEWARSILADPELGGAGHQTAMRAVARMRDMFVPEKDRPAFDEFLRITGAGDHPAFIRLLHTAARYFDEPALPPPNPVPPKDLGRRPGQKTGFYRRPA